MTARCKVAVGIVLFTALFTRLLDGAPCGQPGGICYDVITHQLTHGDAVTTCGARGATLAVVNDGGAQQAMERLLGQNLLSDVWLGMTETRHMWRWVYDGSIIAAQGCYWDKASDRDLHMETLVDGGMNPEKCIVKCDTIGYLYAGVQGGKRCFCGNSFGKHGTAMLCDRECQTTSTISKWCGGNNENFVYYTKGMYGRWGYVEPSSHKGNERCAVIDTEIETKFGDEMCFKTTGYICDIPNSRCNAGQGYHRVNNRCYFMQFTHVTWYEAREECRVRGGDLVKVDDAGVHADLTKMVADSTYTHWQLWIGLTRGSRKWADGTPLIYANWATDEPSASNSNCGSRGVMMSARSHYAWKVAECGATAYVVCQTVTSRTTPTRSTTSTTTTTPTTTTTTTTTAAPTSAAATTAAITTTAALTTATAPQSTISIAATTAAPVTAAVVTSSGSNGTLQFGQSNSGANAARSEVGSTGLSYTEFGLLIFGVIILLIIIVIVIVLCIYFCCCRRNKVRSSCYDARNVALIPNDGYNTDLFNSTVSLKTVGELSISSGNPCGKQSCPADNWHHY